MNKKSFSSKNQKYLKKKRNMTLRLTSEVYVQGYKTII